MNKKDDLCLSWSQEPLPRNTYKASDTEPVPVMIWLSGQHMSFSGYEPGHSQFLLSSLPSLILFSPCGLQFTPLYLSTLHKPSPSHLSFLPILILHSRTSLLVPHSVLVRATSLPLFLACLSYTHLTPVQFLMHSLLITLIMVAASTSKTSVNFYLRRQSSSCYYLLMIKFQYKIE
jgi:hypothetical protein